MFSSSILTVTGKSDFQFSKFCNINRALEPNIQGSEYATMIRINRNKFRLFVLVLSRVVLLLSHIALVTCCIVLCRVVLVLSRVVPVLSHVVSCFARVAF